MWFRRRPDSDFDAEIESHIRQETDRLIAEGMPPEEARAAARRAFGSAAIARERFYESRRCMWLESVWRDLRYGVRWLARTPSFTITAGLTVALGIGINTAVFSLLDAVLLRPLPVADPASLVFLTTSGNGGEEGSPPYRAFPRLRERISAFTGMAAYATDELRVEIDGHPEPVNGQVASEDYFALLGIQPALGRLMEAGDEKLNPPVAVISHRYWRRRFGGDPSVLGRTFSYGRQVFTIVGVTADGFSGLRPGFFVDLTIPISRELEDTLGGHFIVARLKPGRTPDQARAEAAAALRGVLSELSVRPEEIERRYRRVELPAAGRGDDSLRGRFSRPLYALMGIAALVLALAAANIANLLLARGFSRAREFAIRQAAGAGRGRLVRQIVVETVLLFVCGAIPGIALAQAGVSVIEGMFAEGRRTITLEAGLNWRVLAFASAVTLAAGIAAALLPAWRIFGGDLERAIREGQTRSSESRGAAMLQQALVASQVAVSMVLLAAAITLGGTLSNLRGLDPGFRGEGVLTMSVELPEGYVQSGKAPAVWSNLAAAVRGRPGVKSASLSTFTPLSQRDRWREVAVEGYEPLSREDGVMHYNQVSEGYFETLGIALLDGRLFTVRDTEGTARVAVINRTAARKFFAGRDPLGRALTIGKVEYRIAGVVADSAHNSLREPAVPFVLLPLRQPLYPERRITLAVAGAPPGGEEALLQAVRRAVGEVDSRLMVSEVISMRRLLDATLLTERLLSSLATAFGALAMSLASVGLYGVLTYRVGRQRQAIGIRMALGATPSSVAGGVFRQSALVIAAGMLCGLPFAVMAALAADSLLWGVKPEHPAVYLLAAAMLSGAGLVSAWLPARRASGVDPVEALRRA